MKRTLLLACMAAALLVSASVSYADVPVVGVVPDVILGDTGNGQTVSNYFRYGGFSFSNAVTDEDGNAQAAIYFPNANDRNLSISGISRVTATDRANWAAVDFAAKGKNLLSGSNVIRGYSDLWNGGSPIAWQGGAGEFGPQYAFDGTTAGSVLVDLLVRDPTTTAATSFLVSIGAPGSASTTSGAPLFSQKVIAPNADATNWTFFTAYNGMAGCAAVSTSRVATEMTIGATPAKHTSPDYYDFVYGNISGSINLTPGEPTAKWIDGVLRARWTVTSTQSPNSVPELLATVVPPGGTNVLNGATQFYPSAFATGGLNFSIPTGYCNGNQEVLPVYFYGGTFPAQLNATGNVTVTMGILTKGADVNGQQGNVTVKSIFIDVLPHPTTGGGGEDVEYDTIKSLTAAQLDADFSNWIFVKAAFISGTNLVGAFLNGVLHFVGATPTAATSHSASDGIRITEGAGDLDCLVESLRDLQLTLVPGQLYRVVATAKDFLAAGNTPPRSEFRFNLNVGGRAVTVNTAGYTGTNPAVQPTAAGTVYELYLEAPKMPAGVQTNFAIISLDLKGAATAAQQDVSVSDLKVHTILTPY